MRKCNCGHEVNYDGFNEIDIVDGYIVIKGDANCEKCGKNYEYEESYVVDFNNPFDVELEELD